MGAYRLDLYDQAKVGFPDLRPGQSRVLTDFRFLMSDIYRCSLPVIRVDGYDDKLFGVVDLMDWFAANTADSSDG